MENEHHPYFDKDGNEIDFQKKRLGFWLETVPPEIRRLEYELWKRYRTLHLVRQHEFRFQKSIGRFKLKPEFTGAIKDESWEAFKDSFLHGEERSDRFKEIVNQVGTDLPEIYNMYSDIIPKDKIRLVALSGSSVYGPRREGEFLSDIDINFLLDSKDGRDSFEVIPKIADSKHYHLVGTGNTDQSRGERSQIHWILYPHYPIYNQYSDDEVRGIISNIVADTRGRSDEIGQEIDRLDNVIKSRSKEQLFD